MTTRSVPKIIFIICLFSYLVIRSFRYCGLSLFIIVYASTAIIRIRLTFKECYSDLAKSSSHLEWFSLSMNIARLFNFLLKYIKYNVLSTSSYMCWDYTVCTQHITLKVLHRIDL